MPRITINPFGRSFPIQKRVWTFFKNWFVPKMICKRFIKQSVCEKALFFKILISPSFKGCRLENALETPFLLCKSFTLQKRNDFKPISKQVSKPFDLNSLPKTFCFTKQRALPKMFCFTKQRVLPKMFCFTKWKVLQKTLASKTCLKGPTPTMDIIW